jgi:hypothetical protein
LSEKDGLISAWCLVVLYHHDVSKSSQNDCDLVWS